MGELQICLKSLTPLWTGGVDQTCDRLHETGLIGSLRWWYEAIVRGLGGYACDPTAENTEARCSFDSKAYEKAKTEKRGEDEAIREGLRTVCPVCYVFGCTGWARLFQLRAIDVPMTPLHFRTTLPMNRGWLKRVFGGEQVPYGDLRFLFTTRRYDDNYAKSQFALVLRIAAEYGGIGARMQHGFGQFVFPPELSSTSLTDGLAQLKAKIQSGALRSGGPSVDTPFDLKNFVALSFHIPTSSLSVFVKEGSHIGRNEKKTETRYLPCAFDLRYKGNGKWGMRQWLKGKGWRESDNPKELGELDLLLGPRSQWGPKGQEKRIQEELRTAGRVFFGMPYQEQGNNDVYVLKVWAFLPPEIKHRLPDVQALKTLLEEYIQYIFGKQAQKVSEALGHTILGQATGGTK